MFALICVSVAVALIAVEVAIRTISGLLPTGSYGSGSYDPELQMNTYSRPVIYNKGRRGKRRLPKSEVVIRSQAAHPLALLPKCCDLVVDPQVCRGGNGCQVIFKMNLHRCFFTAQLLFDGDLILHEPLP